MIAMGGPNGARGVIVPLQPKASSTQPKPSTTPIKTVNTADSKPKQDSGLAFSANTGNKSTVNVGPIQVTQRLVLEQKVAEGEKGEVGVNASEQTANYGFKIPFTNASISFGGKPEDGYIPVVTISESTGEHAALETTFSVNGSTVKKTGEAVAVAVALKAASSSGASASDEVTAPKPATGGAKIYEFPSGGDDIGEDLGEGGMDVASGGGAMTR